MRLFDNLNDFDAPNLETIIVRDPSSESETITYKTYGSLLRTAIAAVGFSFGTAGNDANKRLADALHEVKKIAPGIDLYAQQEVCHQYQKKTHKGSITQLGPDYDPKLSSWKSTLNSWEVLDIFKKKFTAKLEEDEKYQSRNIVLVAHPAQIQRVLMMAKKIGFNGIPFVEDSVKWSKKDLQLWTRSGYLWTLREVIGRIYCKAKGYID